jgi:thioredoxin 1
MRHQFIILLVVLLVGCSTLTAQSKKSVSPIKQRSVTKDAIPTETKSLITFVELGSVKCIPCKAMQPIMKSIEEKYGKQVKVIFYDVWKEDQARYATEFNIRLIPTQVFLDASGKELMRHEGFYPEKEIDAFLQSKGLKPNSQGKG